MDKKKIVTIVIVLATILLAGVAIFTAVRLYQLRQQPVAPTAPTSEPAASVLDVESCTAITFTLSGGSTPTSTPTGSPTATPTSTPITGGGTATPTSTPIAGGGGATPTPDGELTDAGVSYPTIISVGFGILLILGSLLLVF